ncbi:hypothetical protein ISN45_At02g001120 [Arabidopsis thaliana x Arabidopsis arenosa]|uniref:Uncharacterized protein n=1 Tax=Arabidopsis thaliana x Arabidopsis arenosa TaxID=1240361 RepID=A0A8T2FGY0_9BRAS|nr:hypothetical protein ISN45_At02g001120 [Arabidopsis thaliana x Arabidopsis arenosa]
MWRLQRLIILLLYRVRYFPITIRRYHRSSVGVILLRLCLSGFQISKFVTDRSHHNRVFDYAINISILNRFSQNKIWNPRILNFEIGDDGEKLWLDRIHQRRLIIYLTVMDYYLSGRKQFTISREFNALFMSTPTWKDITISIQHSLCQGIDT